MTHPALERSDGVNRSARLPLLLAALGWLAAGLPGAALAQPFEPDGHTLLLAHFDESVKQADYALGISRFAGIGARATSGYYGQAVDLRARGLWPDFVNTCSDYGPQYDGWGFHARGNVSPWQGTFECFFKPADPKAKKLLWSSNFLNAELGRSVKSPKGENYVGFGITLNTAAMRYCLPTAAGNAFMGEVALKSIAGFERMLDANDWHHFAMTWSPGELVIYLDGRAILSFDMTDQKGLVLLDNPVRYLSMSDCVIDELRISNVVRYRENFEPAWQGGKRPAYAFTGDPAVKRYDPKMFDAPQVRMEKPTATSADVVAADLGRFQLGFDRRSGELASLAVDKIAAPWVSGGLMLHQGVERRALKAGGATGFAGRDGRFTFTQRFDGGIEAGHELAVDGAALVWKVTLTNRGEKEAWLEPLLGVPAPMAQVTEIFDGVEPRRTVSVARHRDEYCSALPFTAAAGQGRFIGVGIDPQTDLSEIVSQWSPGDGGGIIRQGTKVVLGPGESFTYPFHIVAGEGDFDTLDAVAAFHGRFPALYRLRPDVSVYSYMPMTQGPDASPYLDIKRLGYAGNIWGHGPGHDKGDEIGNPDWWDNPKFYSRPEYERYTRKIEKLWGSLENLRKVIPLYFQECYDNYYPVRRYHICPDVTPRYIAESCWPGYKANEDPLTFGQYYEPILGWWIVNEYQTPIGDWFRKSISQYLTATNGYCNGFINDMSHAGSLYRHNDPIAQQTAGRAFARDLGPFVRKALGRKQRYEMANHTIDHGYRSSFWSDGGSFSYTLGAYSAGIAIEGAGMYRDLVGSGRYLGPARFLAGEKPFSAMTHENDDWVGYDFKPADFTPQTLRDYYRYCGSQLVLFCLDYGVTLDPGSYMLGRQFEQEMSPLMVESAVLGRKVVHGARVDEPLWVRRSGEGLGSLLIVGNHTPKVVTTDVRVYNRYFGGDAPLYAGYFGGGVSHAIEAGQTKLEGVTVGAREPAGFKAVAMLQTTGPAKAATAIGGDGLTLNVGVAVELMAEGRLALHSFGPLYRMERITVDGRVVEAADGVITVAAGKHRVEASYQNRALAFTAEQWAAVELFREGRTNFQILADAGLAHTTPIGTGNKMFRLGFDRGTAMLLNDFVEHYDDEDGRIGNLPGAALVEQAGGESGWTVVLSQTASAPSGQVRIDPAGRRVMVEGATPGEIRRAMVVWMRLVDRKYPHVGRFFPLNWRKGKYDADQPVPFDKWVARKPTREFYEKFVDARFLAKPILRGEFEGLYAGDNMDFTGRYTMRYSPFVFEPTYGDDYVYGYNGPGQARTGEVLRSSTRSGVTGPR